MVNIEELEKEMEQQNVSDANLAKAIGIDVSTWYRRKQKPSKIQIGEVEKIKAVLNLPNYRAVQIFLS